MFLAVLLALFPKKVWNVLTDYARLGDVVPSLVSNEVVATRPDGVRLKQVGAAELIPGVNFKVRVMVVHLFCSWAGNRAYGAAVQSCMVSTHPRILFS